MMTAQVMELTVENILSLIEKLSLPDKLRLRTALDQTVEAPPAVKAPLDKRLPNQPWPEGRAAMDWLREHSHEYRGQWVALAGNRLVAHGTDRAEVRAAHQAAGLNNGQVLLHYIAAADEPPFMGI